MSVVPLNHVVSQSRFLKMCIVLYTSRVEWGGGSLVLAVSSFDTYSGELLLYFWYSQVRAWPAPRNI
jgi:hypothetical protein